MNHSKFLTTFVITLRGSLDSFQIDEGRRLLNLHYVGDETVNEYNENNVMVGKYDDHPNFKEMQESHYKIAMNNISLKVKVGLCKKGRLHFIKTVK